MKRTPYYRYEVFLIEYNNVSISNDLNERNMIIVIMEIILSKEKAKQHGIDMHACYKIIDDYFLKYNVKKIKTGVYLGINDDYSTFLTAIATLPKTRWFLKIVDEWYFRYEKDHIKYCENLLKE